MTEADAAELAYLREFRAALVTAVQSGAPVMPQPAWPEEDAYVGFVLDHSRRRLDEAMALLHEARRSMHEAVEWFESLGTATEGNE